jgi:uncharacterized protein (DUF488 family)
MDDKFYALYDLGYADFKDPNLLAAVQKLDGRLVDIRYSPRARVPAYNQGNLTSALGERYAWLRSLGNVNYKGGPIQILDMDSGLSTVMQLLREHPVFLMCACWNRLECHRFHIVRAIEQTYGVKSQILQPTHARLLLGEETISAKPLQASLF